MKRRLTNEYETTGETDDQRRGSGGGYGRSFEGRQLKRKEMVVTATVREREREREKRREKKDVFSNNKIQ